MALLPHADPLLILATVLAGGLALGQAVQRIHLPGVTGQILAGVLLGSSGLHVFDDDSVAGLEPPHQPERSQLNGCRGAPPRR